MRKFSALCSALLALCLMGPTARAAEAVFFVEIGVEHLDGAFLGTLEPGVTFESRPFDLHVTVPLRFDFGRSFAPRLEDWDGLSDAGRILRHAELRLFERAFQLKIGVLAHESMGHGTLVQGFVPSLDPDVLPLGARMRVAVGPVAVEGLISDVFGPDLFGGSVSVEPVSLFGPAYDRLHLTTSLFADPRAPISQGTDAAWLLAYGVSTDWTVVRTSSWQLAPYFDANFRGAGYGFHAGLLADVVLSDVELSFQGEWRWARAPYLPDYFDTGYALERFDLLSRSNGAWGKAEADFGDFHSGKFAVRVASGPVSGTVNLAGVGDGRWNSSLVLNLTLGSMDLGIFGALRNFKWGYQPDRLLLLGEWRYRFLKYLYAWVNGGHLYRLASAGNRARAAWLVAGGLGFAMSFGEQAPGGTSASKK